MILDMDRMAVGRRLRVLRVAAGLRLWELAARASVPQSRISELENGRRPGTPQEWERLNAALAEAGQTPGAMP